MEDRIAVEGSGNGHMPNSTSLHLPARSQSGGQSSSQRSPVRLRPLPPTSPMRKPVQTPLQAPQPIAPSQSGMSASMSPVTKTENLEISAVCGELDHQDHVHETQVHNDNHRSFIDRTAPRPSSASNEETMSDVDPRPIVEADANGGNATFNGDVSADGTELVQSSRNDLPFTDASLFASHRAMSFSSFRPPSHDPKEMRRSKSAGSKQIQQLPRQSSIALPPNINGEKEDGTDDKAEPGGWLRRKLSGKNKKLYASEGISAGTSSFRRSRSPGMGLGTSLGTIGKTLSSFSVPTMSLLSFRRTRTAKRGSVVSVASEPEVETDWEAVMTSLRREKYAAEKRLEEQYTNRSLWCLESDNVIREWLIKLVEWEPFNHFVLFLIIANCTFLMFDDPVCKCEGGVLNGRDGCTANELYRRALYSGWNCDEWDDFQGPVLYIAELVFTGLFTAEMVIKIIARGFALHKHSYLRDRWNWIDFVVVIASLASLLPNVLNVQFLRTVRVLRPLRTMTRIKGMKPLIKTFLRSFRALGNVILLLLFFFCVFGILGIELLSGALRGRCYVDPTEGANSFTPAVEARLVSQQVPFRVQPLNVQGTWNGGVDVCSPFSGGKGCEPVAMDGVRYNTTCSRRKWCGTDWCKHSWNANPFGLGGGQLSYDNIFGAFLSLFQTLTLEGWSDLLYMYQDGWSYWGSRIFHSSWVIIGSFFVIQLALAVLVDTFMKTLEDDRFEIAREALDEESILIPKTLSTVSAFSLQSRAIGSLQTARRRSSATLFAAWDKMSKTTARRRHVFMDAVARRTRWCQRRCRVVVQSSWFQNLILAAIIVNILCMALDWHDQGKFEDSICKRRCELDPSLPGDARCSGPLYNRTFTSDGAGGGMHARQRAYCYLENDEVIRGSGVAGGGGEGESCAAQRGEAACQDVGGVDADGRQCVWFKAEGKCKLGLYNSTSFARIVLPGSPREQQLSLRQLCGPGVTDQCPDYPTDLKQTLESANLVLVFVFIAEMMLKLTGLGWRDYFADSFNLFDCFIVGASIAELSYTYSSNASGSGSLLASLRGLRLFRLFKLARSWESMRKILNTLGVAMHSLGPLTIVWIMFMYIFGLLCMQLFGGQFRVLKADFPRSNFDSFLPSAAGHGAFVVIFQIITTENWINIMYSCIVSAGNGVWGWLAGLVTICIVMFGNYMIMNLFISILLEGFAEDDEEQSKQREVVDSLSRRSKKIRKGLSILLGRPTRASLHDSALSKLNGADWGTSDALPEAAAAQGSSGEASVLSAQSAPGTHLSKLTREGSRQSTEEVAQANPLRRVAEQLVSHPVFDYMMLLCILISSLILILEQPDDHIVADACPRPPLALDCSGLPAGHMASTVCPRSADHPDFGRAYFACGSSDSALTPHCCAVVDRVKIFWWMDSIFTFLFLVEACLKVLARGLVLGEHAYLRNSWNWLDAMIVATSLMSFFGDEGQLKALKALRAFRTLRPLRVITRNPGLKVAVKCLVSSIPAMMNVIVVVIVWFSMYAMLGVQAFKGILYRCASLQDQLFYGNAFFPASGFYTPTPQLSGEAAVPTIIECVDAGNVPGGASWEDQAFSFNSYPDALLALFEMATTEGWLEVMAAVTDAVHTGVSPLPNFRPWVALYCVAHIIIGAFILLNLIVGFVINNYNKIRKSNNGITPFLTQEQHAWKEIKKIIYQLRPKQRKKMPLNPWRAMLFKAVTHRYFEFGITFLIIANVIVMMFESHDQDPCIGVFIFWANFVFACLFTVEATVKITAFGFRWYFLDRFNMFDFFVVILVDASVGLAFAGQPLTCHDQLDSADVVDVYGINVVRAFRIARVFRLIRQFKGLRKMIETLMISLPSLANIAGLLALMIVIFAVLGVTFFYNVRPDQDPYGRLGEHCNYVSFDSALWTLHRQTTGEAWNGIMYYSRSDDVYRACDKCYGGYLGDGCGGAALSIAYHVLWQLFGTYVLMQLFTAVILENFSDMAHDDTAAGRALSTESLNQFVEAWTDLDPEGREILPIDKLPELLTRLPPPLGVKDKTQVRCKLLQLMKDLAIPIHKDHIAYKDTFKACVKRVLILEGTKSYADGRPKFITCAEEFAARSVQMAFREWRETKLQVRKAMSRPEHLRLYASPRELDMTHVA